MMTLEMRSQLREPLVTAPNPMDYTGERMVPEMADAATFWEHVYRYKFACQFAKNKAVLDIACGEGYGTAALVSAGAASAIGVDISAEACRHAREKYGVETRPGDAESIPVGASAVDLVVSFETIEHVPHPIKFVKELKRILRPGGVLIISTPNKAVYDEGCTNRFHCSEMNLEEFVNLLSGHFQKIELLVQVPTAAAWWSHLGFALRNPRWTRFNRFKKWRGSLCRPYSAQVLEKARNSPVPAILGKDSLTSNFLNPYLVRNSAKFNKLNPIYYIAVCR